MWDLIKSGSNHIVEMLYEGILGFFYKLASDLATDAVKLVTDFVVIDTSVNKFFDVDAYLDQMKIIAVALIVLSATWEGFKQVGGASAFRTEEQSIGTLVMKSFLAVACVQFLPWSVTHLFIKINNLLIKLITAGGVKITGKSLQGIMFPVETISTVLVFMMLVLAIATLILGVLAGIRYVEIVIIILIAPLVAVSVVRNGDALDVWIKETISVVFTQALQVFLLQFMLNVVGKMNTSPLLGFIVTIGSVVVMISGPKVLRKFVYSTGTGSAASKSVGQAGRMAAIKYMSKAVAA